MTICSFIIPTFNTRQLTLSCVGHILKNPPSVPYDIVIVDNHSTDGTCEAVSAAYPQVTVLRNEANLGFSRACNRGAGAAQGRFLCFLNSDTEPLPGSIQRLLDWLETHPQTGIVGPELLGPTHCLLQMSWVWNPVLARELLQQFFAPYVVRQSSMRRRMIQYLQRKPRRVPAMCGACLMVRRETFDALHGFDEEFELYFEDSDFCLRCLKGGWTIDFLPDAKIIHYLGQSTRGLWSSTSLIYQQSHIAYYRKHAPRWAVALLKGYLFTKYFRLRYRAWKEHSVSGLSYCQAYRLMISERAHFTLQKQVVL